MCRVVLMSSGIDNSLASQQTDKQLSRGHRYSVLQTKEVGWSSISEDLLFMGFAVSEFFYLVTQQ